MKHLPGLTLEGTIKMKKFIIFLCGVALVLGLLGNATATELINNGDFETGDLTGWNSSEDVQVVDFGNSLAGVFAGIQGMDGYFALLGAGTSDEVSTLNQYFSLTNVSQVTLSFDWAFDFFDLAPFLDDTLISLVTTQGDSNRRIQSPPTRTLRQGLESGFGVVISNGPTILRP